MLKKGKRLTAKSLKQEQKRFKDIAPIYQKNDITKFEEYVCNAFTAMVKTVEAVKIDKEKIELIVYLHQFEFFEKKWIWENYEVPFLRQEKYGKRRSKNVLQWLDKNGYIEFFKHKKITYQEFERSHNSWRTDNIESQSKYKLSIKGLSIVREYFKNLTGDTPSKLDKSKKRALYKGETPWDNIDYTNF